LRDALLDRLRSDLATEGLILRVVRLSRESWDLTSILEESASESPTGITAVVGLEETPGIVPEEGSKPKRPQALAVLNHLRAAVRQRIPTPFLLWCDPFTYTALQEHAPDFFDHYTAVFAFQDAQPVSMSVEAANRQDLIHASLSTIPSRPVGSQTALRSYEEKLEQFTEPTDERARMLLGLAEALCSLHDSHLSARLIRAKAAAQEALTLLTQEDNRLEWARGQNVLGTIISDLPIGSRGENLGRAIACYEAALRVWTEADFPQQWAMTQNNLGIAYSDLPMGDRGANLGRAIACYEAALRVYTATDSPQQWAATQHNLGTAYSDLPTGDRGANLGHAIACYEAALRVRAEADFPQDWAMTQFNLGLAFLERDANDKAYQSFEAAARGFRFVGLEELAREAEALREGIAIQGGGDGIDGDG
jgi:tetratricopeptide (TPR) repeat protein